MKFISPPNFHFLLLIMLANYLASCATSKVTFSTDQKATVSIVSFSDPNGDGQILGESPQTIELPKLKSGLVKIWGKDLQTQYWVFNNAVSSDTKIAIKMKKSESANNEKKDDEKDDEKEGEEQKDSTGDGDEKPSTARNLSYRLLLRSYFALSVGKYSEARELAGKLKELAPKIAAPHIITGISHIQEGNNSEAKSALQIALSLDPEDNEAISLMEALR